MARQIDWDAVIKILKEKGLQNYKCPICGSATFSMQKEFTSLLVNGDLDEIKIGQYIPAGTLLCNNCGHLDFFALTKLGLPNLKGEE